MVIIETLFCTYQLIDSTEKCKLMLFRKKILSHSLCKIPLLQNTTCGYSNDKSK